MALFMPTEAEQQVSLLRSWASGEKSYPVVFFKMLFSKGCVFAVESVQTKVSIFKGKPSISLLLWSWPGRVSLAAGLSELFTAQWRDSHRTPPRALKDGCLPMSQYPPSHKVS